MSKGRRTEQSAPIILYQTTDGKVSVNVRFEDETFWMTQRAMAELFGAERGVITKHLYNIYLEEELDQESTCAKFAQVQIEVEMAKYLRGNGGDDR